MSLPVRARLSNHRLKPTPRLVCRYDYYTLEYWTGLLNTFLDGGDASSLYPPPASSSYQSKL